MSEREKQTREAASQQAIQAASQPPTKRLGEKSKPRVPGMAPGKSRVQMRRAGSATGDVHAAAARGVASPTTRLPFADKIQASFGDAHDVSKIQAHIGGDSAGEMGANAYASGNHVVFDRDPDLHTAAHEAAHVIQQAHGVNLYGGVGEAGDAYERHADEVADRVVAGRSAVDLLGNSTLSVTPGNAVQMEAKKASTGDLEKQRTKARSASFTGVSEAIELCAFRIHSATSIVTAAASASNCQTEFTRVRKDVERLAKLIQAQGADSKKLGPKFARINGTFSKFTTAWEAAKVRFGDDLPENSGWIHSVLVTVNLELGTDAALDVALYDDKKTPELVNSEFNNSLTANLDAVQETSTFLRMSIPAGASEVVSEYIARLRSHMHELADVIGSPPLPAGFMKPHQSKLKAALAEIAILVKQVHSMPPLETKLLAGGWTQWIQNIRGAVKP